MDGRERRGNSRGISMSPLEWELIDKAAAAAGLNRSQWMQEAVHEKLARDQGIDPGEYDTVRRPARRRPNRARSETEGQQS